MPTTCAMPPGSVCTLYVRSSSRIGSPPPRGREPPVAEQVDHLAGVALARDEEDVADPRELEELERVVDHRPAPDRQQVLVRDARQLAEARRLAAGADEALRLHARDAYEAATAACARASRHARRARGFPLAAPGYGPNSGDPDVDREGPDSPPISARRRLGWRARDSSARTRAIVADILRSRVEERW